MTIKTYTEQLEEVQAAITAIMTGAQTYTINGRTLTRANLSDLDSMEQRLRRLASREAAGGISVRGVTPV